MNLFSIGCLDFSIASQRLFAESSAKRSSLATVSGFKRYKSAIEPTNGLDPYWIAKLKKYLIEEKKRQQIVLFSTHLLSLAEEIADRVILLHEGELLASGTVSELLEKEQCMSLEQLWLKLTGKELLI